MTTPTLTRGSVLMRIDVMRGGQPVHPDDELNALLATECEAPEMAHAPFLYSDPTMAAHVADALAHMLEPRNYRIRTVTGRR